MRELRRLPTLPYAEFSHRMHVRAAQSGKVIKAQLELTYRCNLRCRHCYTDPYNSKEYLPRELTLSETHHLLNEMRDAGIIWLNLTGGDILMHPDFFDIYESAARLGFVLQLYTNGTLFTRAVIERLQDNPPLSIDISCHSVNEDRFDWFTQVPGSYRAFMRGIVLLRESGLPFSLKTKLMSWNKEEVGDLCRFTESLDQPFDYTTALSPRLNGDCSSLAYRIDPQDLRALEQPAGSRQEDVLCSRDQVLAQPDNDRLFRCGCGTDTIHINAWGELGTCTLQYESRVSLRESSLKEAIRTVFAAIRASLFQSDTPCRSCTLHSFCDKQPTHARWEFGQPEAPIPYACDVAMVRAEGTLRRRLIHPLRRSRQDTA
ncbi:MAG: hypothetical protein OJF47_001168 [Nitrospira sp.]|nr:MAG: hypothetical protein OJF47_001168 [Nitrospira sp.]